MNADDIRRYLASSDAADVSADVAASALRPGERIGGLVAVALIGRGATGDVWRVHDEASGQDLALKLFRPRAGVEPGQARERFRAEARLLGAFRHPNLMRAFASGTFRGEPYFTMELLRPLPESLSPRSIAALGRDLCRALACLHAHGIVHRDLKPDNVLVAPDGRYVLADLGIAHLSDDALSGFIHGLGRGNPTLAGGTGRALGTPGFAAPEQMQGKDISPAADIHALGALFAALFDGRPPLAWRILIRDMTSSLPTLRCHSLATVRRALTVLGALSCARVLTAVGACLALVAGIFACCRPKWEALPVDADQRCVIRMEGMERELKGAWVTLPKEGHYTYPGPLVSNPGPEPYRKPGEARLSFGYFRRPFVVAGPGALKIPLVVGHDVYLVSNATLVTSGTLPTNDFTRMLLKRDYPTDSNGHSLLFPTFHVEPGSRVIFTENPHYSQALIDCPKDSIRTLSFRSDPFL